LRTLLATHPSALEHDMGLGHPERPDRVRAIDKALSDSRFDELLKIVAPKAEREDALRVHSEAYLTALEKASPSEGLTPLDSDTAMNPSTLDAAYFAAGGALAAVAAVIEKKAQNAFVVARPPGHHAGVSTPMGFCFLNNVAIAARNAIAVHGAERVAIVDFDVHHGNGTQEIFWADPNVLFCSTHQAPFYPGTGWREERGEYGTIVNAPLRAGADGEVFAEALQDLILPRIKAFRPDLLLISAGFDAHRDDPLGGLMLEEQDFFEATQRLLDVAETCCEGRVVSLLEGGYHLNALARSVAAHVSALQGA
jgi:acetoin utilization deacetylase AcuC-like enzyme